MPLKRQLRESEIPIFDNAYINQRGDYWQLHMWLEREGKYARKSLRTRSQSTAVEQGELDELIEAQAAWRNRVNTIKTEKPKIQFAE